MNDGGQGERGLIQEEAETACADRLMTEIKMNQKTGAPRRRAERYRVSLHKSSLAEVEDAWLPPAWAIPPLCEAVHQFILPYEGLFACTVGRQHCLIDASRTLFIAPGREYSVRHPVDGTGDAALIVAPSAELLDEICGSSDCTKSKLFAESSRPSSMRLRLMTQQLRHLASDASDPLRFDEWIIRTLHEAVQSPVRRTATNRRSVVEDAKAILHARVGERISLHDVAREVGVSPVYLTQEFTRYEGAPLYRYSQRLRLSQALAELPQCGDITGLALDLGFSSHSHFTVAFRKAFGLTPSAYRSTVGSPRLRIHA